MPCTGSVYYIGWEWEKLNSIHKVFLFFMIVLITTAGLGNSHTGASETGQFGVDYCQPGAGLDLMFVLDNSGTVNLDDTDGIRSSTVSDYAENMLPGDRGGIISFHTEADMLQEMSDNRYDLLDAVSLLPDPSGGTDLSQGMRAANEHFVQTKGVNKQIMVLITDGADTINLAEVDNQVREARMNGITIFTLGLGSLATGLDEALLRDIADQTRGQYRQVPNATVIESVLQEIRSSLEGMRSPQIFSDWTLTDHFSTDGDLEITKGTRMNLNGYNLEVGGDLVMANCSSLRAVEGEIRTGGLDQDVDSILHLNDSRMHVEKDLVQDGNIIINGPYRGDAAEIRVEGHYHQGVLGSLRLAGRTFESANDVVQEGNILLEGGTMRTGFAMDRTEFVQRGHVDTGGGSLYVNGFLYVDGGPLAAEGDERALRLNANNGYIEAGRIIQDGGQFYVNRGHIVSESDYIWNDGWLTMVHDEGGYAADEPANASLDRMIPKADFVDVKGNFIVNSRRNTKERAYMHLNEDMSDPAHLTGGILRVGGLFQTEGDREDHLVQSDRFTEYADDFSRFNFAAAGNHRVILTGERNQGVEIEGRASGFNILELSGTLFDYGIDGNVNFRWNHLIETEKSLETGLRSLTLNGKTIFSEPVNQRLFLNQVIPGNVHSSVGEILVNAIPLDPHADVHVLGNRFNRSGEAEVIIEVAAAGDSSKTEVYELQVIREGSGDRVTGVQLANSAHYFVDMGRGVMIPEAKQLQASVTPHHAENRALSWRSSDTNVVTVSANGRIVPQGQGQATVEVMTEDGGYTARAAITVDGQNQVLSGVHHLQDFFGDDKRYDRLLRTFTPSDFRVFVPGYYIQSTAFNPTASPQGSTGYIHTRPVVQSIEIRINNGQVIQVPRQSPGRFALNQSNRTLQNGDFIEITARNSAGDELEKLPVVYPIDFTGGSLFSQSYRLDTLFQNQGLFNNILSHYSPQYLQIEFD